MTAIAESLQADVEGISAPRAVVVGIMAGDGVQIGVLLDANAPVSVMTDPLLKVVNSRLRELEEAPLEAEGRGRWSLCLVDGTPLRATQSLTEQDVYDGDRLWIRFIMDTERRSQVIEHISTAVASDLSKRFASIDPVIAIQVGASMVAGGVVTGSALLGWWRWHHNSWLTTIYAAVIAVLALTVAVLVLSRANTRQDRRAGDIMLLGGIAPLTIAAASAPPGPVGSPQALLGFAVLTVAAAIALKFTGRRLSTYTAIITVGLVATIASLARMVASDQCGHVAELRGAGLRAGLPLRTGVVPSAVGHPAAGLPVGDQPVGLRGTARPADHGDARQRWPPGLGRTRVGARRAAAGRACPVVPVGSAAGPRGVDGLLVDQLVQPAHRISAGCRCCWPASARAS